MTTNNTPAPTSPEGGVSATYGVTGMTCGHCVSAVTEEVKSLPGVSNVQVELNPEGTSMLTITSEVVLDEGSIAGALDEAGDYKLAAV